MTRRRTLAALLGALLLSGFAGLVNQVAWQRGLKIFLGGSEALSSMTVVLVFMLGLGVGSGAFASKAEALANPLRRLAWVEVALCLANLGVATLLSTDLSESVYAAQRAALGLGVPLRALYAAGAVIVLGVPCFLMGVTIPLASEACQRQLGHDRSSLVNVLLYVNTSGAVLGALASGFLLLPRFGQSAAILTAASLNGAAGALLFALAAAVTGAAPAPAPDPASPARPSHLRPTREDVLGLFMGLLSLGYEMYLFRAMALAHEPLPYTFAAVLGGFLTAWSLGAFLAARLPGTAIAPAILATAVLVAAMPPILHLDRWSLHLPLAAATVVASLPVIGFGLAYGGLVSRNARRWGSDVGRFGAWNTAGSCAGILLGTLVGYEMSPEALSLTLAAGVLAVYLHEEGRIRRIARPVSIAGVAAVGLHGAARPGPSGGAIETAVYDRDGVVEVDRTGSLVWDGLWHSSLSDGTSHVGSANWLMAVAPVLVHPEPIEEALVVGVGAGITVGTLAKVGTVRRVDGYDINRGLEEILHAFPMGTLEIARNPRVRLLWQDGRSGLALRPERYDLITQQPLYLKQAGSSVLLSREYFRLVQRRLRQGGVFAIYSNSLGNPAQSRIVRETAASVFRDCVTFDDGYAIVCSDEPIVATEESFRTRIAAGDLLGLEMAAYDAAAAASGGRTLFRRLDARHAEEPTGWVVTDDHPLVEYPGWSTALVPVTGR